MAITTLKVFPPIGIARVGDSPDFFIGPELPGDASQPPGGYRDSSCRIRRQAARFRIYAYDENGQLIIENGKPKEIRAADGQISWTVELANRKSAWKEFDGLSESTPLRNAAAPDRAKLAITPGARTLNGPNQSAAFNTGQFLDKFVALGEVRTDADGRCLVTGGFGHSESVPPGLPVAHYANNTGWHDDISDGPVNASVVIGGQTFQAAPAWVVCAPPKFAPPVESLTSLFDMLVQVAVNKALLPQPGLPSLTKDIYPILRRVVRLASVTGTAAGHHGSFDLVNPQNIAQGTRQSILARLRDPNNVQGAAQATMPLLWDDVNGKVYVVTKLQYRAMQKWAGQPGVDWINDWAGPPAAATEITPDGLTRAALEACVGGALFPGIEASWMLRDKLNFTEAFRIDHTGRDAGDVTKQMAVPWQADFYECRKFQGYAWWPAPRPDDVLPASGGSVRAWTDMLVSSKQTMVDNWFKLGFVVEQSGQLVEIERRAVCRGMMFVTDKSSFAADEVSGVLAQQNPAAFGASLYVITEGFLPAELNIPGPNPTPAQLLQIAPQISFGRPDNSVVPGMSAVPEGLLMQVTPPPASLQQRFTFVYRVEFTGIQGFSINGQPVEEQIINATATKNAVNRTFTALAHVRLFQQPNPYMLDGAVAWLSTDLRVFKVTEGEQPFSNAFGTMGNTPQAALAFIDQVVSGISTPQFESITNQAPLELSRQVNNKRVFNFAVAKVHYRAQTLAANSVRVFFRLFTTAATGTDYDENSTYRRSQSATAPIALLGVQAGYVVTIPCYGRQREDTGIVALDTQTDTLNQRNLPAGANELIAYFGCWLDFNQTEARFPRQVSSNQPDGPWASGRLSIMELIRGQHQCLVAEIRFDKHPIHQGENPASCEGLAQRNLVITESDNPGTPATHTVQDTFEIKATKPQPTRVALLARWNAGGAENPAAAPTPDWFVTGPDELMIRWDSIPRSARLTVYMPDIEADHVLELAAQRMDTPRLTKLDEHTLECAPGDVSFIPLPEGRVRNSPALLTIELPDGIKRDQVFNGSVHQMSGFPRAMLGAFQVRIPVSNRAILLEPEIRKLSVLRHIAKSIPLDDPWHAVFRRYLDQIAARVDGFGGDSTKVAPSPDGTGRDEAAERCKRSATLFVVLLALAMLLIGIKPLVWLGVLVTAATTVVGRRWWDRCHPGICRMSLAAATGLGIGAGLLVIANLLQVATPWLLGWLALVVIVAAGLLAWTWWRGCAPSFSP